jgi:hypothetical protein
MKLNKFNINRKTSSWQCRFLLPWGGKGYYGKSRSFILLKREPYCWTKLFPQTMK